MIRFLTALGVVIVLIYLSIGWMMNQKLMIAPPSWQNESIVFLVVLTIPVYAYLHRLSDRDPRRFTLSYLGSIVFKILAGCVFVVIMIRADRERAFLNAGFFLITYVAFTFLEVILLFRESDRRVKKS